MAPHPVSIRTRRLSIAAMAADDRAEFTAYRQDPEVARYQGWETSFTIEDADALIRSQPATYEIGVTFARSEWRRAGDTERSTGHPAAPRA